VSPQKEVEVKPKKVGAAGVGVFMCTLTFLGTRLGGGIVGVPGAAKNIGFMTVEIMMFFYAFMCMLSLWMLLRVREITKISSYPALGIYLYGKWSIYLFNGMIALSQCGVPIIFMIVFGDVASSLIRKIDENASPFWTSRWFTHSLLAFGMLYLIIKKEIQQLKYASLALLAMTIVFITLLTIHFFTSDPAPEPTQDLTETKFDVKFYASLPTVIVAFAYSSSLFTVFGSLKNKTIKNGLKAAYTAIWVGFIVYTVIPLIGFGLYGANIQSNLLKNIAEEAGVFPTIIECIFMVIAIMHIPICFFIGKEAFLIMFDEATRGSYTSQGIKVASDLATNKNSDGHKEEHKLDIHESKFVEQKCVDLEKNTPSSPKKGRRLTLPPIERKMTCEFHESHEGSGDVIDEENEGGEQEAVKADHPEACVQINNPKEYLNMHPFWYYSIVLTIYAVIVLLSIVVGDVSFFFGIIGATAGSMLIFLGPGSFYIITKHKHNIPMDTWFLKFSYVAAWFYSIIGFLGIPLLNACVIINYMRA
jgi:amino acid permease